MSTAIGTRGALRFLTCGSVDDGKSTLIGRILLDCDQVYDDQLTALRRDSRRHRLAEAELDPSLLVDGLEAEREQGITIDVAYRYFRSMRRNFIVADCPGHEQYTRNMATGASGAEAAVLLVDARKGVLVQTHRHAHICSLFGIRRAVLAVNKMDLVDHDEGCYRRIVDTADKLAAELGFLEFTAVPVSALQGDNVARHSERMPWYTGPTVLEWLEQCDGRDDDCDRPMRLPVQWVNRPDQDRRGYAGTLASGRLAVGDRVEVAGKGIGSRITRLHGQSGECASAVAGDAVMVELDAQIDLARGDILAAPDSPPDVANHLAATLIWLGAKPFAPGRNYQMIAAGGERLASVTSLRHRLDVNTGGKLAARTLEMNEIGVCHLRCGTPLPFDPFDRNRTTGAFILVDRETADTVAAGVIAYPLRRATNLHHEAGTVTRESRRTLMGHGAAIIWMTGLSGSGKSTIARQLELALHNRGAHTYVLDGDNIRLGINRDLGFTEVDRIENIRRIGEVATLMAEAGLIVIGALISPFQADRETARTAAQDHPFIEVFIDTPISECRRRDPKGLYAKADAGLITNFTGINSPYEPPLAPEITIRTKELTLEAAVDRIVAELIKRSILSE
jgi:bifunctional enzyme CysN/CysC